MFNNRPVSVNPGDYTPGQFHQFERYIQQQVSTGNSIGSVPQVANALGIDQNAVNSMRLHYGTEQHHALESLAGGQHYPMAHQAFNAYSNSFDQSYYSRDLSVDECLAAQDKYELAQAAYRFANDRRHGGP